MTIRKVFLTSTLIFLVLSVGSGILWILTGSLGDFLSKILLTTISLGAYSLTALCCSSILDRPNLSAFASLGVGASILGAGFAVLTNWEILTGWEFALKGRFSLLIIAVSLAHVSLLLRIKAKHYGVNIARGFTVAAIAVVALLLLGLCFETVHRVGHTLEIFVHLDVLGTIGTPILHQIFKPRYDQG